MKKYFWYRTIFNAYEPNNEILVKAELVGREYLPTGIYGVLSFNDGSSIVKVHRNNNGSFDWQNADRKGTADSFEDAYQNMPAMVTNPDHFEDSDISLEELEEL